MNKKNSNMAHTSSISDVNGLLSSSKAAEANQAAAGYFPLSIDDNPLYSVTESPRQVMLTGDPHKVFMDTWQGFIKVTSSGLYRIKIVADGSKIRKEYNALGLLKHLHNARGNNATSYDYSPDGAATARGIDQPIQWSSEYHDAELALTYYNYRHYNPTDGRWIHQDPIQEGGGFNLYGFIHNSLICKIDYLGLKQHSSLDYKKDLRGYIDKGSLDLNQLFFLTLKTNLSEAELEETQCNCAKNMDEILDAWGDFFGTNIKSLDKNDQKRVRTVRDNSKFTKEDFDKFQHFIASAQMATFWGENITKSIGVGGEILDTLKARWGDLWGTRKSYQVGYDVHDQKWNNVGANFGEMFGNLEPEECQKLVKQLLDGSKKLSDFYPDFFENGPAGAK